MSLRLKLRTLARTVGHWDTPYEAYRVSERARALTDHYLAYPERPGGFDARQSTRDAIIDEVYAISGADPKYYRSVWKSVRRVPVIRMRHRR